MEGYIGPRARVATSFACAVKGRRRIVSVINQGLGRSRADVPQKNCQNRKRAGAEGAGEPDSDIDDELGKAKPKRLEPKSPP